MKKLGSILIAFLLVFSLVGTNVFADENTLEQDQSLLDVANVIDDDSGDVSNPGDENPGNENPGDDLDNNIADKGIDGFNADALREDLADGVRQGTIIDVLDYFDQNYDQVSELTVDAPEGGALISSSRILLFRIGNVEFTVSDGKSTEKFEVEVLEHPVTGLSFDKTEATIGVGESVDMLIDFVPEDGWDDAFATEEDGIITIGEGLNLSVEYEGSAIVSLTRITDDEGNFMGVRVTGRTTGSGELTAFITDEYGNINEDYQTAVATINVASGEVNPIDYTPPVTPVTPVAEGEAATAVNTADSMLLNIYVAAGMLSLAALVVVYKKKAKPYQ